MPALNRRMTEFVVSSREPALPGDALRLFQLIDQRRGVAEGQVCWARNAETLSEQLTEIDPLAAGHRVEHFHLLLGGWSSVGLPLRIAGAAGTRAVRGRSIEAIAVTCRLGAA